MESRGALDQRLEWRHDFRELFTVPSTGLRIDGLTRLRMLLLTDWRREGPACGVAFELDASARAVGVAIGPLSTLFEEDEPSEDVVGC